MQTSEQLRAARAVLRWEQSRLAQESGVSVPTIKRMESQTGPLTANRPTIAAIRQALETAGIEFVDAGPYSGDGGPGVRLRSGA
ncbi:Transcriptional regulator [Hyphomicrobiales bacterium]|nr:Transcriptional regulator [Hyphomicrobiales bacterium]CAH1673420.1 Transcriptional regulator [Hyphomicrobiales bacterium]